ncbi:basic salivary proline-rich protein 2-like [Vulpes lagopus]|uniref:basic salivary proline-rich protein 2-like n=1 Tax=Vulpes lagopus TaxID=494514 RepID=UPI001BCA3466|nr:basic salivary proline-rich protein 2-like [Vulpes lagopus]
MSPFVKEQSAGVVDKVKASIHLSGRLYLSAPGRSHCGNEEPRLSPRSPGGPCSLAKESTGDRAYCVRAPAGGKGQACPCPAERTAPRRDAPTHAGPPSRLQEGGDGLRRAAFKVRAVTGIVPAELTPQGRGAVLASCHGPGPPPWLLLPTQEPPGPLRSQRERCRCLPGPDDSSRAGYPACPRGEVAGEATKGCGLARFADGHTEEQSPASRTSVSPAQCRAAGRGARRMAPREPGGQERGDPRGDHFEAPCRVVQAARDGSTPTGSCSGKPPRAVWERRGPSGRGSKASTTERAPRPPRSALQEPPQGPQPASLRSDAMPGLSLPAGALGGSGSPVCLPETPPPNLRARSLLGHGDPQPENAAFSGFRQLPIKSYASSPTWLCRHGRKPESVVSSSRVSGAPSNSCRGGFSPLQPPAPAEPAPCHCQRPSLRPRPLTPQARRQPWVTIATGPTLSSLGHAATSRAPHSWSRVPGLVPRHGVPVWRLS